MVTFWNIHDVFNITNMKNFIVSQNFAIGLESMWYPLWSFD
jgi:hypothetical protein